MKKSKLEEIVKEELLDILIEGITKNFAKAVEAYRTIQLKQQELRKKFVGEKDPKKKEALKQKLITLHKKVQKAESDFNAALKSEPIEDDLMEKSKGLWANIHAKRKRGEKGARKGSKAYKKAKKAADDINRSEGKLNENFKKNIIKAKTMKDIKKIYPKAVKPRAIHGAIFYVELEKDLWAKCFSTNSMKSIEPFNVEAIYKMKGKKQTFLWKEGKVNEAFKKGDKVKYLGYPAVITHVEDKMGKTYYSVSYNKGKGKTKARMILSTDGSITESVRASSGPASSKTWKNFIIDLEGHGKLLKVTNTDNRKTVKARKTDKVWDDGVPVLKYIARASKKDSPLPKGKFTVAHDTNYGWWYYKHGGAWYGIQTKDYGTPPFEY